MKGFVTTIGKHTFTLTIKQTVLDAISRHESLNYDELTETEFEIYSRLDMTSNTEKELSYEEAKARYKEFMDKCATYVSELNPALVAQTMPKKKNGTFAKNRIDYPVKSTLGYLAEDEYGFRREALRWKAMSDTEVTLDIVSYVESW